MTDRDLQEHVQNALDWEPSVDAADIGVSVESGVVTLCGDVRRSRTTSPSCRVWRVLDAPKLSIDAPASLDTEEAIDEALAGSFPASDPPPVDARRDRGGDKDEDQMPNG